eukprot:5495851-Heterocapsa_arctica.AAC.1
MTPPLASGQTNLFEAAQLSHPCSTWSRLDRHRQEQEQRETADGSSYAEHEQMFDQDLSDSVFEESIYERDATPEMLAPSGVNIDEIQGETGRTRALGAASSNPCAIDLAVSGKGKGKGKQEQAQRQAF